MFFVNRTVSVSVQFRVASLKKMLKNIWNDDDFVDGEVISVTGTENDPKICGKKEAFRVFLY